MARDFPADVGQAQLLFITQFSDFRAVKIRLFFFHAVRTRLARQNLLSN